MCQHQAPIRILNNHAKTLSSTFFIILLNSYNKSYERDPSSFYPWYFRGILAEKKRDASRASKYFSEALRRAEYSYQKTIVNIHQQDVARLKRDTSEQENLLKKNIADNPKGPHVHGNYASYLMKQERYAEAVKYWKRAVELGSYRHAEEQLEKAKRLEEEKREQW